MSVLRHGDVIALRIKRTNLYLHCQSTLNSDSVEFIEHSGSETLSHCRFRLISTAAENTTASYSSQALNGHHLNDSENFILQHLPSLRMLNVKRDQRIFELSENVGDVQQADKNNLIIACVPDNSNEGNTINKQRQLQDLQNEQQQQYECPVVAFTVEEDATKQTTNNSHEGQPSPYSCLKSSSRHYYCKVRRYSASTHVPGNTALGVAHSDSSQCILTFQQELQAATHFDAVLIDHICDRSSIPNASVLRFGEKFRLRHLKTNMCVTDDHTSDHKLISSHNQTNNDATRLRLTMNRSGMELDCLWTAESAEISLPFSSNNAGIISLSHLCKLKNVKSNKYLSLRNSELLMFCDELNIDKQGALTEAMSFTIGFIVFNANPENNYGEKKEEEEVRGGDAPEGHYYFLDIEDSYCFERISGNLQEEWCLENIAWNLGLLEKFVEKTQLGMEMIDQDEDYQKQLKGDMQEQQEQLSEQRQRHTKIVDQKQEVPSSSLSSLHKNNQHHQNLMQRTNESAQEHYEPIANNKQQYQQSRTWLKERQHCVELSSSLSSKSSSSLEASKSIDEHNCTEQRHSSLEECKTAQGQQQHSEETKWQNDAQHKEYKQQSQEELTKYQICLHPPTLPLSQIAANAFPASKISASNMGRLQKHEQTAHTSPLVSPASLQSIASFKAKTIKAQTVHQPSLLSSSSSSFCSLRRLQQVMKQLLKFSSQHAAYLEVLEMNQVDEILLAFLSSLEAILQQKEEDDTLRYRNQIQNYQVQAASNVRTTTFNTFTMQRQQLENQQQSLNFSFGDHHDDDDAIIIGGTGKSKSSVQDRSRLRLNPEMKMLSKVKQPQQQLPRKARSQAEEVEDQEKTKLIGELVHLGLQVLVKILRKDKTKNHTQSHKSTRRDDDQEEMIYEQQWDMLVGLLRLRRIHAIISPSGNHTARRNHNSKTSCNNYWLECLQSAFGFLKNHARLITFADVGQDADTSRSNNKHERLDNDDAKVDEQTLEEGNNNSMQQTECLQPKQRHELIGVTPLHALFRKHLVWASKYLQSFHFFNGFLCQQMGSRYAFLTLCFSFVKKIINLPNIVLPYQQSSDESNKYSLVFIELLIGLLTQQKEQTHETTTLQAILGKIIFLELTDQEHEHLFIRSVAIKKDYSLQKQLFIVDNDHDGKGNNSKLVDFIGFIRLTNSSKNAHRMNLWMHQLRLYALLCANQNYLNIQFIRGRFPYYVLLEIIKNQEIHSLLRGLFVDLYVKVYVDVKQFRRIQQRIIEGETEMIGGEDGRKKEERDEEEEEEMMEIVNDKKELTQKEEECDVIAPSQERQLEKMKNLVATGGIVQQEEQEKDDEGKEEVLLDIDCVTAKKGEVVVPCEDGIALQVKVEEAFKSTKTTLDSALKSNWKGRMERLPQKNDELHDSIEEIVSEKKMSSLEASGGSAAVPAEEEQSQQKGEDASGTDDFMSGSEYTEEQSQSKLSSSDASELQCREFECRPAAWIHEFKLVIMHFLEELVIVQLLPATQDTSTTSNQATHASIDWTVKLNAIAMNYLCYALDAFRQIVELNQCGLQHKLIKLVAIFLPTATGILTNRDGKSVPQSKKPNGIREKEQQQQQPYWVDDIDQFKCLDKNLLIAKIHGIAMQIKQSVERRQLSQKVLWIVREVSCKNIEEVSMGEEEEDECKDEELINEIEQQWLLLCQSESNNNPQASMSTFKVSSSSPSYATAVSSSKQNHSLMSTPASAHAISTLTALSSESMQFHNDRCSSFTLLFLAQLHDLLQNSADSKWIEIVCEEEDHAEYCKNQNRPTSSSYMSGISSITERLTRGREDQLIFGICNSDVLKRLIQSHLESVIGIDQALKECVIMQLSLEYSSCFQKRLMMVISKTVSYLLELLSQTVDVGVLSVVNAAGEDEEVDGRLVEMLRNLQLHAIKLASQLVQISSQKQQQRQQRGTNKNGEDDSSKTKKKCYFQWLDDMQVFCVKQFAREFQLWSRLMLVVEDDFGQFQMFYMLYLQRYQGKQIEGEGEADRRIHGISSNAFESSINTNNGQVSFEMALRKYLEAIRVTSKPELLMELSPQMFEFIFQGEEGANDESSRSQQQHLPLYYSYLGLIVNDTDAASRKNNCINGVTIIRCCEFDLLRQPQKEKSTNTHSNISSPRYLPFIYQAYALRAFRKNLEYTSSISSKQLFSSKYIGLFDFNYLCALLCEDDFYDSQEHEHLLVTIFKSELIQTLTAVMKHYADDSQGFKRLLMHEEQEEGQMRLCELLQKTCQLLERFSLETAGRIHEQMKLFSKNKQGKDKGNEGDMRHAEGSQKQCQYQSYQMQLSPTTTADEALIGYMESIKLFQGHNASTATLPPAAIPSEMELFYDPLGLIHHIFSVIAPFVTTLKTTLSNDDDLMIAAGEYTHTRQRRSRSNIDKYLQQYMDEMIRIRDEQIKEVIWKGVIMKEYKNQWEELVKAFKYQSCIKIDFDEYVKQFKEENKGKQGKQQFKKKVICSGGQSTNISQMHQLCPVKETSTENDDELISVCVIIDEDATKSKNPQQDHQSDVRQRSSVDSPAAHQHQLIQAKLDRIEYAILKNRSVLMERAFRRRINYLTHLSSSTLSVEQLWSLKLNIVRMIQYVFAIKEKISSQQGNASYQSSQRYSLIVDLARQSLQFLKGCIENDYQDTSRSRSKTPRAPSQEQQFDKELCKLFVCALECEQPSIQSNNLQDTQSISLIMETFGLIEVRVNGLRNNCSQDVRFVDQMLQTVCLDEKIQQQQQSGVLFASAFSTLLCTIIIRQLYRREQQQQAASQLSEYQTNTDNIIISLTSLQMLARLIHSISYSLRFEDLWDIQNVREILCSLVTFLARSLKILIEQSLTSSDSHNMGISTMIYNILIVIGALSIMRETQRQCKQQQQDVIDLLMYSSFLDSARDIITTKTMFPSNKADLIKEKDKEKEEEDQQCSDCHPIILKRLTMDILLTLLRCQRRKNEWMLNNQLILKKISIALIVEYFLEEMQRYKDAGVDRQEKECAMQAAFKVFLFLQESGENQQTILQQFSRNRESSQNQEADAMIEEQQQLELLTHGQRLSERQNKTIEIRNDKGDIEEIRFCCSDYCENNSYSSEIVAQSYVEQQIQQQLLMNTLDFLDFAEEKQKIIENTSKDIIQSGWRVFITLQIYDAIRQRAKQLIETAKSQSNTIKIVLKWLFDMAQTCHSTQQQSAKSKLLRIRIILSISSLILLLLSFQSSHKSPPSQQQQQSQSQENSFIELATLIIIILKTFVYVLCFAIESMSVFSEFVYYVSYKKFIQSSEFNKQNVHLANNSQSLLFQLTFLAVFLLLSAGILPDSNRIILEILVISRGFLGIAQIKKRLQTIEEYVKNSLRMIRVLARKLTAVGLVLVLILIVLSGVAQLVPGVLHSHEQCKHLFECFAVLTKTLVLHTYLPFRLNIFNSIAGSKDETEEYSDPQFHVSVDETLFLLVFVCFLSIFLPISVLAIILEEVAGGTSQKMKQNLEENNYLHHNTDNSSMIKSCRICLRNEDQVFEQYQHSYSYHTSCMFLGIICFSSFFYQKRAANNNNDQIHIKCANS